MGEERLVKRVEMEALSLKGKGRWWENLERCLADLRWGDVRLDSVKGMSNVKYMLQNCAWREVTNLWAEELEERQKLGVLNELVRGGFEARCVGVRRKKIKRTLTKLEVILHICTKSHFRPKVYNFRVLLSTATPVRARAAAELTLQKWKATARACTVAMQTHLVHFRITFEENTFC